MTRPAFLTIAVVLTVLLCLDSLGAQILRGRLIEEGSGEPIAGAFVVLYASEGDPSPEAAPLDGDLTGPDGRFALTAPRAGSYRLRVDRIGYRSHLAGPFELGSIGALETTIAAPLEPIELPAIVAEVEPQCEIDPRQSRRLALTWEEVRKALATAAWAQRRSVFRFTSRTYQRMESPSGQALDESERLAESLQSTSPYVSLPIEDLVEGGYVRYERDSVNYYAPDAEALLSDPFLDDHCFRLVPGTEVDQPGWIGLAFEPVEGRRKSDIEGVIWIDRSSSELRRLDFEYAAIPDLLARYEPGGRIEFERVPTGGWIVRRWWIRAPSLELSPGLTLVNERRRSRATVGRRARLVGYVVSGGEVLEVAAN